MTTLPLLKFNNNQQTMFHRVTSYESTASGISVSSTELAHIQECKEFFESAKTVNELQQRTIQFLKGDLAATAYHLGPLLAESDPLKEKLIHLNELGFITTSSQPGGRDRIDAQPVEKRFFVEGILERRYIALFLQAMYTHIGNKCFIAFPETERTYQEIQDLQATDLYWVTRNALTQQGLLHITEAGGPCQAFQTCEEVYPQLADEYVTLFICDTRWGHNSHTVLDTVITVLQHLKSLQLPRLSAPRNKSR